MRAKFTSHGETAITIDYTDACDVRQNRTFEQRGTYVWELSHGGRAHQVRKRLACSGATLQIKAGETLWSVVRREYRAMQAADKRALWSI